MKKLNNKAYSFSEFILVLLLLVIFCWLATSLYFRHSATEQARQAESFMRAVRYEQEDRCASGRKYTVYANQLRTFLKRKQDTQDFMYDLASGTGITAKNKWHDYTLKMPSYADGRICCDHCDKLNRRYSSCALLKRRSDFIAADEDCVVYTQKQAPSSSDKTAGPLPLAVSPSSLAQEAQAPQMTQLEQTPSDGKPEKEKSSVPETDPAQPADTVPAAPETDSVQSVSAPEETGVSEETAAVENPSTTQTETEQPSCPAPEDKGSFYINPCDTYQPGAQGAVLFTWNTQTCQYDVTQNCLLPARWKTGQKTERTEKGVYPSDVEKLCSQLLVQMGCPEQAAADKECFEVDASCYSRCEITDKTQVQESSLIVLYDVSLSLRKLQCAPSKNITVEIP